jgi:mRNA-degrading endonuclease RelE of RelBE toxin-antitoxin system
MQNIFTTPTFEKGLKPLRKKYKSILQDLADLLATDFEQAKEIKNNVFKLRLKISSKNKGKSAGARIIFTIIDDDVYLVFIYDKSEISNLNNADIDILIAEVIDNLETDTDNNNDAKH